MVKPEAVMFEQTGRWICSAGFPQQLVLHVVVFLVLSAPSGVGGDCLGVAACSCETGSAGRIINCRSAGLTSVPRFNVPTAGDTYVELTLAGNQIGSIPARSFIGQNFQKFDATDNPLTTIDDAAFSGLETRLTTVLLTLSSTAAFPTGALAPLTELVTLHISGFTGSTLPRNATWPLQKLKELYLVSGGLTTLNAYDLVGQQGSLQTIVLQSNNLAAVPSQALSAARMLETIDLSSNRIGGVPAAAFPQMVWLTTLDLSNNGLGGNVDAAAFRDQATKLTSLRMQSCQLVDRSVEALRILESLSELHLAYNAIANLPNDLLIKARTLRVLNLDSNRLTTVSKNTFANVGSTLESLNLGRNPLTAVPVDTFRALSFLRELHLDAVTTLQQLDATSFTAVQQRNVRLLSLRETNLGAAVWPLTGSLVSLQTLDLSRCGLTEIPDFVFRRQTALASVDLSSNTIASVTQRSVYGLENSLRALSLSGNRIATMAQCTFSGFQSTFSHFQVELASNPLRCDCGLRWLYTVLRNENAFRLSSLSWTCDSGRRFAQLTDADFASCPPVTNANCSRVTPPPNIDSTTTPIPSLIQLTLHDKTDTTCVVTWSLTDESLDVLGFIVTSEAAEHHSSQLSVFLTDPDVRTHRVSDLLASTEYLVCVTVRVDSVVSPGTQTQSCVTFRTDAADVRKSNSGRTAGIVVGCVLGGLLLVGLALAVFFYVRSRRRATAKKAERAASMAAAAKKLGLPGQPHVGYGSKRYSRRPPGAADFVNGRMRGGDTSASSFGGSMASVASNGLSQPDAFTAEERAKISAMLDGTRGVSVVSAGRSRHSSGTSGRSGGYRNAGYAPTGDSKLTSPAAATGADPFHVYDAIPGDQYEDIPLDSVV